MKKTVNFRFSEETLLALAELSHISWSPRTHVLEGLILAERARIRGGGGSLEVSSVPEPKVLPKDPKEVEKIAAGSAKKAPRPRTQVDPDKIAEAQKWLTKKK